MMRATFLILMLAFAAAPAAADDVGFGDRVAAGAAVGSVTGLSILLTTTATIPLFYALEAGAGNFGEGVGGLVMVLGIPTVAGFSAGVVSGLFCDGFFPVLVGVSAAVVATISLAIATAAIAFETPQSGGGQLAVAGVYLGPALSAGAVAGMLSLLVVSPEQE